MGAWCCCNWRLMPNWPVPLPFRSQLQAVFELRGVTHSQASWGLLALLIQECLSGGLCWLLNYQLPAYISKDSRGSENINQTTHEWSDDKKVLHYCIWNHHGHHLIIVMMFWPCITFFHGVLKYCMLDTSKRLFPTLTVCNDLYYCKLYCTYTYIALNI